MYLTYGVVCFLLQVTMSFNAPKDAGDYTLILYFMSDSYLGCDQEYEVPLSVEPGEEEEGSDGEIMEE